MKTTTTTPVSKLKKLLPKDFVVTTAGHGLTVNVSYKLKGNDHIEDVDKVVYAAVRQIKELGEPYCLPNFKSRGWEFINKNVEKKLVADAKRLCSDMKAFFKKWSNLYCESNKAYDLIEKMRDMINSGEA